MWRQAPQYCLSQHVTAIRRLVLQNAIVEQVNRCAPVDTNQGAGRPGMGRKWLTSLGEVNVASKIGERYFLADTPVLVEAPGPEATIAESTTEPFDLCATRFLVPLNDPTQSLGADLLEPAPGNRTGV